MFDSQSLKTQTINGKRHYTFKPNAITYAVEADSQLGKKIARSKFGIVFHTGYNSLNSGAQFGVNVSGLKDSPVVWYDDAFFKDTTGNVLLTSDESKQILTGVNLKFDANCLKAAATDGHRLAVLELDNVISITNETQTDFYRILNFRFFLYIPLEIEIVPQKIYSQILLLLINQN